MPTADHETRVQVEAKSPKAEAQEKIRAAEVAIADAAAAVFRAVAAGEVDPCLCHYTRMGCAQDDMERVRKELGGERPKGDSLKSILLETLTQTAPSGGFPFVARPGREDAIGRESR